MKPDWVNSPKQNLYTSRTAKKKKFITNKKCLLLPETLKTHTHKYTHLLNEFLDGIEITKSKQKYEITQF